MSYFNLPGMPVFKVYSYWAANESDYDWVEANDEEQAIEIYKTLVPDAQLPLRAERIG